MSEQKQRVVNILITGPVVDVGAEACKAMKPGVRHRYYRLCEYTTEDGTIVKSVIRDMTKPKLNKRIEERIDDVKRGFVKAVRYGSDVDWSIILSMSIDLASGMVSPIA